MFTFSLKQTTQKSRSDSVEQKALRCTRLCWARMFIFTVYVTQNDKYARIDKGKTEILRIQRERREHGARYKPNRRNELEWNGHENDRNGRGRKRASGREKCYVSSTTSVARISTRIKYIGAEKNAVVLRYKAVTARRLSLVICVMPHIESDNFSMRPTRAESAREMKNNKSTAA